MSDIEELVQLLGQPGEDLDWGGEHFCFLEYEHEQAVVANQQLHHPQQDIHQPPHILASADCSSGNKRRMSEAFQCQAYPSHSSGPVLVPAPAPACLPIILNNSNSNSSNSSSNSSVSSNSTATGRSSSRSSRHAQLLSVKSKEDDDSVSFLAVAESSKASTPTSSSSYCFSEEAEQEQERQEQSNGKAAAAVGVRTEAVAQRMERKKTREKMRRQEVNDKLNELMEVLVEADSKGQTPAEKQQQQAQAASIDKGNFRVDVLSRAVRVIKRLNEEVKAGQAEVERLRAQLEQTFLQPKRELQPQEQQQQSHQQETAVADSSSAERHSRPCNTSTTSSKNSSNSSSTKLNQSMTWVTVPMWMPSGPNVAHGDHAAAMAQAKGIMLDANNGGYCGANGATPFPYATMPFFVPQHAQGHIQNGGMVGMPSMMMPAGGGGLVEMGFGGDDEGGVGAGQTTSFAGLEVWGEEAPTHAPCA